MGSWLDDRLDDGLDDVPEALAASLRGASNDLEQASADALDGAQALARVRAGAEPLLTADALITYACQRALENESPEAVWTRLLERLGRAPGRAPGREPE